jgi:REP-associated tyrosine transposase
MKCALGSKVPSGLVGGRVGFWRLHYHVVWTTRYRQPTINRSRASVLEGSLVETARELGLKIHAMGIMPDHVHMAISVPPRLALSEVVRRLKGRSSHLLARRIDADGAWQGWQAEYGAMSFGERSMEGIVRYVRDQETHHAADEVWPTFETIVDPDFEASQLVNN